MRPDVRFDEVEDDIREILESGLLTGGRHVTSFEEEVAARCGVDHAVATTSATTALHLALAALDIGRGDEVLVADFTFPATANVVVQTGATPVLVDSGADDFAVDPGALEASLTSRTAAAMPVDPFGQPADHEAIEKIAVDAGIPVIADAACSLGATRHGRPAGSHGLVGCFSFHPRKMVTCGEGGMITTDDSAVADRLRLLRSHGMRRDGVAMRFEEPGFNYRMSEIQAALGRSQLRRLDEILADRRRTATAYDERLIDVAGVTVMQPDDGIAWSYQSYVVVLDDGIDRDAVITALRAAEIETTIGTYACHAQPAFARYGYRAGDLPNSARYQAQVLTLPLVPSMPPALVDRVGCELERALGSQA